MQNLFVCHSQVQLVLAVGLSKGRFKDDDNHLILFTDFALSDAMAAVLKNTYNESLFLTGIYPAINSTWKAKIKRYPKDVKAINNFMAKPYDRVFEVCDGNIPELFILKRAFKLNNNVVMNWLEDGSYPYYVNTIDKTGLNSNSIGRNVRALVFKYLLQLGKFYDFEGEYMGGNKNLTTAYITFKGKERDIFSSKNIIEINVEEYREGINTLFGDGSAKDIENDSVIFVLDKLDTYDDIGLVKNMILNIVKNTIDKNKKLYYKYHPREEQKVDGLEGSTMLDKNLGIEYFYSKAYNKNVTVLGIKSTGLQSAKILGFRTISAAGIVEDRESKIVEFYKSIGVLTPADTQELLSIL